ncbi:MAG TPA: hypothetical protein VNN19_05305 [bacterium]|nr:hypothetical protein [bacterium]
MSAAVRTGTITLLCVATIMFTMPLGSEPASGNGQPVDPLARLGFIVFRKTSLAEVTARLGPGTPLPFGDFVARGWYHPAERVYLHAVQISEQWHRSRRLPGVPSIIIATLASTGHWPAGEGNVADLARPRLSLASLRGPNGIRLGDTRQSVFRALGAGELQGRRGDIESYNYDGLKPGTPDPWASGGDQGFILQVTFTAGRLTRIHIIEAS